MLDQDVLIFLKQIEKSPNILVFVNNFITFTEYILKNKQKIVFSDEATLFVGVSLTICVRTAVSTTYNYQNTKRFTSILVSYKDIMAYAEFNNIFC